MVVCRGRLKCGIHPVVIFEKYLYREGDVLDDVRMWHVMWQPTSITFNYH